MGALAIQVLSLNFGTELRRTTVVPFQEHKNRLINYLKTHPMRMTWTCFSTGFFLDYYSPTTIEADGKSTLASSSSLWPNGFLFIVDLNEKLAEIPGDGNTGRISMTAADDIGGFVAAACTQLPLSEWPIGEWGICGSASTPNEVVAIASKFRGIFRRNLVDIRSFEDGASLTRNDPCQVSARRQGGRCKVVPLASSTCDIERRTLCGA